MWEFKTGNTFGATAFSTYGAFWMSLAFYLVLALWGKIPGAEVSKDVGWFLLAFTIFNTYMLVWSARTNMSVFLVFLTLEITEILFFIGNFNGSLAAEILVGLVGRRGLNPALVRRDEDRV